MKTDKEIWKDVCGYEGLYQVSSLGRVKSVERPVYRRNRKFHYTQKELMLKPFPVCSSGHLAVDLHKKGIRKVLLVHRLVLDAFAGPCPEGMECRHYPDRDPKNNKLDNLSWSTHSENMADMRIHGTSNQGKKFPNRAKPVVTPRYGELNPNAKLTNKQASEIRELLSCVYIEGRPFPIGSIKKIANQYKISTCTVRKIWKREVYHKC